MNRQARFIEKIATANGTDRIGFLVAEAKEVLAEAEDGTMTPRAEVAAALAELRKNMCANIDRPNSVGIADDLMLIAKTSTRHWLCELDATIAKLNLPPVDKAE